MGNKIQSRVIFTIVLTVLILYSLIGFVSAEDWGTGGNITYDGAYTVHTFLSNATFTVGSEGNVTVLIVAGGGSGGGGDDTHQTLAGAGGGAGGLIYNTSYIIQSGTYDVVVGAGGAATTGNAAGLNGTVSSFGVLTATGGGAGGWWSTLGQKGGSGGGTVMTGSGGLGIAGQGNNGGNPGANVAGGGGGGASTAGTNAIDDYAGGYGGNGTSLSINGSSVYYAGGGGAGSFVPIAVGGYAGLGGGGKGGGSDGAPTSGKDYLGGGGGGGSSVPVSAGGKGGSGIVIIRYLTGSIIPNVNVTLNSPVNYYNSTAMQIMFNCTANSSVGIVNLTLQINGTNNYTVYNTTALQDLSLQTTLSLDDGNYNWSCQATSQVNAVNSSSRNLSVYVHPSIFIYFPQNTTYSYFVNALNFSATDTHLDSCWYSVDRGITNTSISCSKNITNLCYQEQANISTSCGGLNTGTYDFSNNFNDGDWSNFLTNSFGIYYWNYTKPRGAINASLKLGTLTTVGGIYTNNTYDINLSCLNLDIVQLRYNITHTGCISDICKTFSCYNNSDWIDFYFTYHGALGDSPVYTEEAMIWNFSLRSFEGNNTWTVYANDTFGNTNGSTVNFFVDLFPSISYGAGTQNDGANLSQNFVYVNITFTEPNLANITFTLRNLTDTVNATVYTNPTYTINWSSLPDTDYTYFVNITDLNNNKNSTGVRRIRLDTNAPNANLSTPINDTYTNNLNINFTVNMSDNLGIQNATLFINNQSGLYNQTSIDIGALQSTVGIVVNLATGIYKWWYQIWDWAGNTYISSNNNTLTIYNKPVVNSITVTTTGGTTGTNFIFNQIINNITVNINNGDNNQVLAANLTVTDPDNIKLIDNFKLNNITYSVWYNNSPILLNKAGTWKFNVSTFDIFNNSNSSTLSISVSTLSITTTASWYGYTNDSILTDGEITDKTQFLYNLYEIRANASKIDTYYTNVLNSINKTSIQDIKVGLNYYLDINISNAGERGNFTANITNLFPTLLLTPYYGAMAYISLEVHNPSQYTDAELYTNINSIAQTITQATNNKFVIYSKNYNTTNLNAMYIRYTSLLYLEPADEADWINKEANLSRTYPSINRIYVSVPTNTLSSEIQSFHGILSDLRTPFNTAVLHPDMLVSSTTNGDLLVFNNLSTAINQAFNFTTVTTSGKDFYDAVHQYVIVSNSTNLTFNVIVDGYNATLIFADDIGQIEMTSNKTATVYLTDGTGSNSKQSNWTDGIQDDNFALYGANDVRIELYDHFYIQANFMTYYGWLNVSYVNFTVTNYSVIIIADRNAEEISKIKGLTSGNVYGYVSVADYSNTNAWNTAKELEVDNWIAANESINLFLDGLDIGLSGVNFSSRFKNLIDYTRITKGKKVILNTYTAYEEYATWGDGVMKESCIQRWNGVSAGSVDNYTREDWTLEVNRARWFKSHGIPVYCQAFGNRTTNPIQIENYTDLINIYYASKVLGYDYFYLTQPDFGYAYQLFVPDLGTSMSNDFFSMDNEVYYRRYSNGIVYYNITSGQGRFDNGRTVTGAQACFNLYDAHGSGVNFDFFVNKNFDSPPAAGDYSIPDSEMTLFGWKRVCRDINVSKSGRYIIDGFVNPRSTIVGQGLNIGSEVVAQYNLHSWYDTTAGAYLWVTYPVGKNWEMYLTINQTIKSSLDTLTNIIQTDSNSTIYKYNLTLSSFYHQDARVYSYIQTIYSPDVFKSIKYYNGTAKILLNTINSSSCVTLEPIFNLTVVDGETFGSCYYNYGGIENKTEWRVMVPSLSDREFELELTDTIPPTASLLTPANNSYRNTAQNYTVSLNDAGGISNATLYIYNSTDGAIVNQTFIDIPSNPLTITVGIVVSLVDGIYHWLYSVMDISNNKAYSGNNTITIDTVYPVLIIKYPENKTYNSSEVPSNLNYTYTETNPQTCWYSVNNGITNISSTCGNNITALVPNQGSNTWMIKMQDNASNANQSYVTFFLDSINPKIYFSNPTEINGAFLKRENIQINVTASDTNDMDVSIKVYNSSNFQSGGSSWTGVVSNSFYYNFSSSYDGVYYFNATVIDAFGNSNYTETRNVTLDRVYPLIEYGDGTPEDYANISQLSIFINTTWTEINPKNITFLVDGVSHINNIVPPAPPVYSDNFTGLTEGEHTYYVIICDSANNCNQTATRTVTLHVTKPTAILIAPANNTYWNTDQNYTVNLTDTFGIKNATLFIYNNTDFINQTSFVFSPGVLQGIVGVVVSLADGTYKWFYNVFDIAGNVFITENNTVTIDTSSPWIYINKPLNNTYATNITYNISSSGANLQNITIYVYNSSNLWNISFVNFSAGTLYGELTGIMYPPDGIYYINSTSCIITNMCNSTETRTLTLDNVYPTISWSSPTLLTGNYNISSIWMNVTSYDVNLKSIYVRLELLLGGTPYLNISYINTTISNESFFYNFTSLGQGNYTMSSWAIDKSGLITYNNNISVIIDSTPPIMNYSLPTPDNATSITTNYFSVNISVTDVNLDTITIYLRSPSDVITTYGYTPGVGVTSASFYKTFSSLEGGIYTYNATANDTIGNIAWLPNRTINIQYYNISVTGCRSLPLDGASYVLLSDISNITGTCLNVTASNVYLDCQGHSVSGNTSILVTKPNFNLKNCIVYGTEYALKVRGNSPASVVLYNSTFRNAQYGINMAPESILSADLITITNNSYGIYFNSSNDGNFINNSIFSLNSEDSLTFINTSYNNIYRMSLISATDTSNDGVIRMVTSTDNKFEDSTFVTGATKLFGLSDYSINNVIISSSYSAVKESVDGTSHLIRQWRFTGYVIDHAENIIDQAIISYISTLATNQVVKYKYKDCYQEQANIFTTGDIYINCGLFYTGSYSWNDYANDGLWNTNQSLNGTYYINYTKPVPMELVSGKFNVQSEILNITGNLTNYTIINSSQSNFNITIPTACLNNTIQFQMNVSIINETNVTYQNNYSCYNGTSWLLMGSTTTPQNSIERVIEEYATWRVFYQNITYGTLGGSTSTNDKGYAYSNIVEYMNIFGTAYPSTPYDFTVSYRVFTPVRETIGITSNTSRSFQFTDEISSSSLSRTAMWLLLGIIYLIGLAASVGFFMVRMREGYSVVDIWKYFIIFVIWFVIFTVIYYVLSVYVMSIAYPKIGIT